jgi:hypothetical protein
VPSFRDAALACYLISRFDGVDRVSMRGLQGGMQRSEEQVLSLLADLAELGLVEKVGAGWNVSRAGRQLGSAMDEALRRSRTLVARYNPRSFLGYVPREWASERE